MTDPTIWGLLQSALGYVHLAKGAIDRGDEEVALVMLEDIRGALGEAALMLSDQAGRERAGFERLMTSILAEQVKRDLA